MMPDAYNNTVSEFLYHIERSRFLMQSCKEDRISEIDAEGYMRGFVDALEIFKNNYKEK